MATVDGNLWVTIGYSDEPTNPAIGNQTEPDYTLGWLPDSPIFGSKSDTQPVTEAPETRTGNHAAAYGFLDFYNRIHISESFLDLGNLVSVQERSIAVFSAYFVPRTLNDVTAVNDEGLVMTEPAPTPLVYAPLQERFYTLSVSTEGPALIDATYTFDFDVRDFELEVVGVRIVAWPWEPNWINPILERLEWNTDIMQAYDGSEQRFALRAGPRVTWEFNFDLQDAARRTFENVVYSWGARVWALPIWVDISYLTTALNAGAMAIPVETDGRDYRDEGLAILVGADGLIESVEIATVAADALNLSNPTINTWPMGTRVYPARTARLLDPNATARHTRNYARGLARFKTLEEIERPQLTETLYRNLPVMEREPNWRDAPEIDYLRKLASIDFKTGREFVEDEAELALPRMSYIWTMLDRDESNYFREWIYARRGRHKGIWLPTWCDDLILADTLAASSSIVDFEYCGLVHFATGDIHRRDIRIELIDGSIYYRRVTEPVTVDATTERMNLNAPIGQNVLISQVKRISWMQFMRLDTDSIEITWTTAGIGEAAIITKGPRNEF